MKMRNDKFETSKPDTFGELEALPEVRDIYTTERILFLLANKFRGEGREGRRKKEG